MEASTQGMAEPDRAVQKGGLWTPGETPESMPEIQRELTMIEGALSALEQRQEEHIHMLAPILREDAIEADVDLIKDVFPVGSEVGQRLRAFHHRISTLEDRITRATYRAAL